MHYSIARRLWLPLALTAGAFTFSFVSISPMVTRATATADPNPLLTEWVGPYRAVPPFDKVKIEYFKPALEAAMTENLWAMDKTAKDSAAPTVENTIVAMETVGPHPERVTTSDGIRACTMAS